jgi:hypothetical protein
VSELYLKAGNDKCSWEIIAKQTKNGTESIDFDDHGGGGLFYVTEENNVSISHCPDDEGI